jgi:hypothetical protein
MSIPPLLNGPIPPYNNPPIHPEYYKPKKFFISNISLGITTIVTTIHHMDYVIGQLIRLLIPFSNGCRELNELTGYVISIPSRTQVELAIDSSRNVSQFISSTQPNQPQIVAIGDINTGHINRFGPKHTKPKIPGSFINISPF